MKTLQTLLQENKSILLPVGHDALSAKIIQKTGFKAMGIGGFGIAATRGYPDLGILSYTEMRDAIINIARSVDIPLLVDGDNGYGDFLNIDRLISEYEREPNINAIFIEDQVLPKRCGHLDGKQIVSSKEMEQKLKIASQSKTRDDLWIMARTDSRAIHDLDEALRRGEKYLKAGADALFIEAPQTVQELEKIGQTFKGTPLLVNMLEGGKTPILSQQDLENMGYSIIAYPVTTLLLTLRVVEEGMKRLYEQKSTTPIQQTLMSPMEDLHDLIGVTKSLEKEKRIKEKVL